jgi:hypothetical protein
MGTLPSAPSSKIVVTLPVWGSTLARPSRRAEMPKRGEAASMKIR